MKNKTITILILAMLAAPAICLVSCKKDKNSEPSILGSWVMSIGDQNNIPVQLSFYANGFFEWVPLTPAENHTRSAADYHYSDGVLTIANDPDCPEEGKYNIVVKDNSIVISLLEDDCTPRTSGLAGTWVRKNDAPERRIEGVWYRNINLEGKQREIVFYTQQNGIFEWIISEPTSVYETTNGRYAIGDEFLVIYNFLDCYGLAYYKYTYTGENRLLITEQIEPCEIRSAVMTGTWVRD